MGRSNATSMWWKLLLLSVYLACLFILSRILEAVAYYEASYLASRLLDPVSLSVRKLKTILDQRGVSYAGVVEKQELTSLVDASGEVSEGELEAGTLAEEVGTSTNFTCGTHFYEEVEDTKDSVWLVQVVPNQATALLRQEDWKALVKKVARFGVRTGIFDCSLDWRLCDRKNWYTSRLILALPQGYKAKDNVIIRHYSGSTRVQAVFDWVNLNLASRIKEIYSYEELQRDWFTYDDTKRQTNSMIRVILFSGMKISPMFYSVLSVQFTGRVKFGTVNIDSKEGKHIVRRLKLKKIPTYMVLTPEQNFTYGRRPGEYLNYHSMAVMLRTLHPEVNDIFLWSLIVINVTCWFEMFIVQGGVFKRLGSLLWSIGKWNCLLILTWLPILGLFQLPYMDLALDYGLKALRLLSGTSVASLVRSDWIWYSSVSYSFLICTFLAFASLVGILQYKYKGQTDSADEEENSASDWLNLSWDGYMSYLFRPMATLTRPMSPQDMDLEVGMELLIERLAVPNFWLRPMISSDYVKDLPVWRYTGKNYDSDTCSDSDGGRLESDVEEGGLTATNTGEVAESGDDVHTRQPLLFTCEKCRALQNEGATGVRNRTDQEEAESQRACAKFVMDGDYKCMCQTNCEPAASSFGRNSPVKERHRHSESENTNTTKTSNTGTGPVHCSPGWKDEDKESFTYMPRGMLPATECVICLEGYRFGVILCGLPCGHSFHQQCIMGWLSRDNHCCPVCRWPTYKAKPCSIHLHAE